MSSADSPLPWLVTASSTASGCSVASTMISVLAREYLAAFDSLRASRYPSPGAAGALRVEELAGLGERRGVDLREDRLGGLGRRGRRVGAAHGGADPARGDDDRPELVVAQLEGDRARDHVERRLGHPVREEVRGVGVADRDWKST